VKLVPQKRVEVRIDKPLMRRVRDVAVASGISDMDILSTVGGLRNDVLWTDDQVTGGAGSAVILVAIVNSEKAEVFVQALKPMWDAYSLQITVSDTSIAMPG